MDGVRPPWEQWARFVRYCASTGRVEVACRVCGTPAWLCWGSGVAACYACAGVWELPA